MIFYKKSQKRFNRLIKAAKIKNNIKRRSVKEIEEEIAAIDIMDIQVLEIDHLFKIFGHFARGHVRVPYEMNIEGVFRCRKNKSGKEFEIFQDLWYPDWSKVNKSEHCLGRCNEAGQSVFYCSTELDTSLAEIRPCNNDIITTIDYIPTFGRKVATIKVNPIGIEQLRKLENGYKEMFSEHDKKVKLSKKVLESNYKIDALLNDRFHMSVGDDERWKYKATIAISKMLLTDHPGMLFPSISYNMNGANYVFKPEVVDQNFNVSNARMWKVTEVSGNVQHLECIKILDSIHFDKVANFKDAPVKWRTPSMRDKDLIRKINL
jgi:hypothetical protein